MTRLLTILEAAVDRYGRTTVSDPVALAGALQAATNPPADHEIDALVQVATTDAIARMRAVLERGDSAERALVAAVDAAVAGGADPESAPWATAVTGAALGLLPRSIVTAPAVATGSPAPAAPAADPAATTTQLPPLATAPRYRPPLLRPALLAAALLVVVTLVASMSGALSLTRPQPVPGATPAPTPPPPALVAPETADAPGGPTTSASADPRSAFQDPALHALAEPYLTASGVSCRRGEPTINVAESVACDLGGGRIGLFTKMLNTDVMRDLRRGFLAGQLAEPGTVRSLRWRDVDGRPGVRTGIPAGRTTPGEGTRVRFVDAEGVPRLYFDQDATACTGYLALAEPTGDDLADLDTLRSYWADPSR